jgi:imidazolonepropionase
MDLLVSPISELHTMNPELGEGTLGTLKHAAVGYEDGELVYVGSADQAPAARQTLDAQGCVGLPGLVDCHTHTVFAGSRAREFERRLGGESYTAILEEGGGILSTVQATRNTSDRVLTSLVRQRLQGFLQNGVTTVEVKSGYGLSVTDEIRLCRILAEGRWPVHVETTFLGAHALPSEYRNDREAYVQAVIDEMIPGVAGLANAVDVYCDRGAFTVEESRRILQAGIGRGLTGRIHAEQVEWTGAAAMAAEVGCTSADHLERLDGAGIDAMASHEMVAVLLPGAQLYLRDTPPPARELAEAGVPLAVATDFNPGSSPVRDLLSCASLACVQMGLTVEEAFLGITKNAALALGLKDRGWIGAGSVADLSLFQLPPGETASASLIQYLGSHATRAVIRAGRLAWSV